MNEGDMETLRSDVLTNSPKPSKEILKDSSKPQSIHPTGGIATSQHE
jgi:hypothetical protein